MKKIAFIVDSLDLVFPQGPLKGGGNLVARHLILEFAKKQDIELYIISGKAVPIEISGAKEIIIFEQSPLIDNNAFLFQIRKFIKDKFDYSLFLNQEAPFSNVLLQAHTSEYRYTNTKGPIISWFIKTFYGDEKIKYSKSRFTDENGEFFVVSERLKDDVIKFVGVKENQVTVSYPGVEIKEGTKAENEVFTFGMTAATSQNKGALDVVLAAFLLKLFGCKFKINSIFSTPKKSKFILFLINMLGLKTYINKWERQTDMTNFYCSCDCLLFPSLNETFGLVALEAASFKVPTIISSTTGVAEIFTNDKNALIYNKAFFPVINLFRAMKYIIKLHKTNIQKYHDIANNAYDIATQYTWEKFADKIYNKIMEQ